MVSDFSSRTYLDYAASTPVDPRVLEKMLPYFTDTFGNPSSTHWYGQRSEAAIEAARRQIADVLCIQPEEILFTSGGSESDNLALRGAAWMTRETRGANQILITPVEHPAVAKTARALAAHHGFQLEYAPVDTFGGTTPQDVEPLLRTSTAVVSIIHGNNEIGTINPVAEIAEVCAASSVLLHTDAVQAAAHLPLNLSKIRADLVSLGGHKLHGPKGIGALFVRRGTPLLPILTGGSQEFGLRAGTSNVPLIVGLAEALAITQAELAQTTGKIMAMRNKLVAEVLEAIPDSILTGHPEARLRNHSSFAFKGVNGSELLMLLDGQGFACSSGSACKTGNPEPSETLLALGLAPEWASGSLRVTLGPQTTDAEIQRFLSVLPGVIETARALESQTA
ncbi:MAG: cysteine desulfurase [Chloroflexi bacterium]|nr:cysteine desulfurase [Chloroflexota bacterium]